MNNLYVPTRDFGDDYRRHCRLVADTIRRLWPSQDMLSIAQLIAVRLAFGRPFATPTIEIVLTELWRTVPGVEILAADIPPIIERWESPDGQPIMQRRDPESVGAKTMGGGVKMSQSFGILHSIEHGLTQRLAFCEAPEKDHHRFTARIVWFENTKVPPEEERSTRAFQVWAGIKRALETGVVTTNHDWRPMAFRRDENKVPPTEFDPKMEWANSTNAPWISFDLDPSQCDKVLWPSWRKTEGNPFVSTNIPPSSITSICGLNTGTFLEGLALHGAIPDKEILGDRFYDNNSVGTGSKQTDDRVNRSIFNDVRSFI